MTIRQEAGSEHVNYCVLVLIAFAKAVLSGLYIGKSDGQYTYCIASICLF